uniref:Uncharacterized protein n=1 Tax=Mustela putorius furo TaxID=9669 RepID=M3Y4P7_MUSPF
MVAEKETLSLNKCPDKMPKRTKLLAPQPLPGHQPHSLVSEGFTVKAMMKNSVEWTSCTNCQEAERIKTTSCQHYPQLVQRY